ncbi:MAG: helix-turn-helix transcriptional regulator [Clostridia bacterium]|nr:helix-turn-helix transcriptional regulator [Clostridia bacterium]
MNRNAPIAVSDTLCFQEKEELYTMICLQASRLQLTLGGLPCFLDGSYLLFLAPHTPLRVKNPSAPARCLHFDKALCTPDISPLFYPLGGREHCIFPLSEEQYDQAEEIFLKASAFCKSLSLQNPLTAQEEERIREFIGALISCTRHTDPHTRAILAYIRQHQEEDLSVGALCSAFHISRSALYKTIKAQTGKSPTQFLLDLRLGQSRQLLLQEEYSVNEAAERLGFQDVNYFIRAFKKRFGITPGQYLDRHKAADAPSSPSRSTIPAFSTEELISLLIKHRKHSLDNRALEEQLLQVLAPFKSTQGASGAYDLFSCSPAQLAAVFLLFDLSRAEQILLALTGQIPPLHCSLFFRVHIPKPSYPQGSAGNLLHTRYNILHAQHYARIEGVLAPKANKEYSPLDEEYITYQEQLSSIERILSGTAAIPIGLILSQEQISVLI